jgi:hypothetical protein
MTRFGGMMMKLLEKIHWRKCSNIFIPKESLGVGLRDFLLFNQPCLLRKGRDC